MLRCLTSSFFFFNDTATTEIYTLSLHDALPIYLGRPEATKEVIRDGWYNTGDIGKMDEDGFVTLTDRLSRFSKIGGEMVPHQKIEDELQAIVGATDRVCVVTAVPDESKGERLVVLHTGMEMPKVWNALNARSLPNLLLPRQRHFITPDERS